MAGHEHEGHLSLSLLDLADRHPEAADSYRQTLGLWSAAVDLPARSRPRRARHGDPHALHLGDPHGERVCSLDYAHAPVPLDGHLSGGSPFFRSYIENAKTIVTSAPVSMWINPEGCPTIESAASDQGYLRE
jgi:hypothetical protein